MADSEPSNDETPHTEYPENGSPDWIDAARNQREPPHREISLRMTVVEYAHRPDRCTIYPPGRSSDVRTSTWVTADRTAFDPLAARR